MRWERLPTSAPPSGGATSTARGSGRSPSGWVCFCFNDTAATEIYTLSLHDALPISHRRGRGGAENSAEDRRFRPAPGVDDVRSEEHTSERQSRLELVCRLLLEK